MSGLFGDPRLQFLDERTRVACNYRGVTNCHDIARAQVAARAEYAPLLAESPDLPLEQFREMVIARERPPLTEAQVAERAAQLNNERVPVYEQPRDRLAARDAVNAELKASKPVQNAFLKTSGAGNSLALVRLKLDRGA